MIELKNIDLENVTLKEQYKKAAEEDDEYWRALNGFIVGIDTKEHVIEEFLIGFKQN